jgi:hypothetical protein
VDIARADSERSHPGLRLKPCAAPTDARIMRRVWRLIAHSDYAKQAAAVRLTTERRRIAVGWGEIGDLRELAPKGPAPKGPRDIERALREARGKAYGAATLWWLYQEMRESDLVVLATHRGRVGVFEVAGAYDFQPDPDTELGEYQHLRPVEPCALDPDRVWAEATRSRPNGYRRTLDPLPDLVSPEGLRL